MARPTPLCLDDMEKYFNGKFPKKYRDYINKGADANATLQDNLRSWRKLKIRPRYLTGASPNAIDTSIEIFAQKIKSPICVSPAGLQRVAHEDGEIATVRGCTKHSNCMAVSAAATSSYQQVAEANQSAYLGAHIEITNQKSALDNQLQRVEKLKYNFIIVTVDNPIIGNRLHDLRNEFDVPESITLPNAEKVYKDCFGTETLASIDKSTINREQYFSLLKTNKTWEDISYITKRTKLPLVIKGILTGEDALKAVANGASGVIVSNHGGRQLDTVPCTMDVLPEVVAAVGSTIPVFVDGGIRHGSDVFKAIALGARAVFIGRPIFWGLAYDGANGVEKVLDILQKELEHTMVLSGCKDVSLITKEHIVHESQLALSLAKSCASKL